MKLKEEEEDYNSRRRGTLGQNESQSRSQNSFGKRLNNDNLLDIIEESEFDSRKRKTTTDFHKN